MGHGLKLLILFLWVCSLYTIGILIFTKGFLLKRVVIADKSQCNTSERIWTIDSKRKSNNERNSVNRSCSLPPTFSKAVLLVIDALRFDFALYNESLERNETLPYQNKLTVIHELLTKSPQNGRLYRFIADPPTTTMQRLKGLTTGSLPTFVDAGSNFASYEITEDNFITKLKEHGKKITFMGDDTWEGLFPQTFNKSFPFPSFNVKDLHTVDNGVIQHLVPELKLRDWDVLIAHFLGVDHCGHKYGPNHRAMEDKLKQMNHVISSVIEAIDNDTVLFLLGDHGMTRTGDHGGDSKDELDAALFVFSPIPLLGGSKTAQNTASQMDLVPTISLLLGLPIPFGNLGTVITDLLTYQRQVKEVVDELGLGKIEKSFAQDLVRGLRKTEVLQLNAFQVRTYLDKYATVSGEMPQAKLDALSKELEAANGIVNGVLEMLSTFHVKKYENSQLLIDKLSFIEKNYTNYLAEIKELCQTLWAKFDMISTSFGLVVIIISMFVNILLLAFPIIDVDCSSILKTLALFLGVGGLLSLGGVAVDLMGLFSAVGITLSSSSLVLIFKAVRINEFRYKLVKLTMRSFLVEDVIAAGIYILHDVAVFSNSFVVNEDSAIHFLAHSLVAILIFCALRKCKPLTITKVFARNSSTSKKQKKENRKSNLFSVLFSDSVKFLLAFSVFVLFGRLATVFRACREEQWSCRQSIFHQQLAALGTEDIRSTNQRLLLSVFSVFTIPIALRQWLSFQGNLNGSSLATLFAKHGLILAPFLMFLHWIFQLVPPNMTVIFPNLQLWHQIFLPQAVYWICLLTIALLMLDPLLILLVLRDDNTAFSETLDSYRGTENMDMRVIQLVFKELKKRIDKSYGGNSIATDTEGKNNAPLVYGLGTAYSSALSVLTVALLLPLVMILGDGLAGSVICLLVQVLALLEIHGLYWDLQSRKDGMKYEGPSWSMVILWAMLGSQYFYFTGHQATIPAIRFEAAFVGLPGDLDNLVLPGLLIFLNTFASQVIFAVALPLLFFWPIIPSRLLNWKTTLTGVRSDVTIKGELAWNEKSRMLRSVIWRMFLMYLLIAAVKVLATACAAALHRRHLMVWKIFAPRFVFEGASFFVSVSVLTLVYAFVLRVDGALTKWTQNLEINCREIEADS